MNIDAKEARRITDLSKNNEYEWIHKQIMANADKGFASVSIQNMQDPTIPGKLTKLGYTVLQYAPNSYSVEW